MNRSTNSIIFQIDKSIIFLEWIIGGFDGNLHIFCVKYRIFRMHMSRMKTVIWYWRIIFYLIFVNGVFYERHKPCYKVWTILLMLSTFIILIFCAAPSSSWYSVCQTNKKFWTELFLRSSIGSQSFVICRQSSGHSEWVIVNRKKIKFIFHIFIKYHVLNS